MRGLALCLSLLSLTVVAEPLHVSLSATASGRWLEGTQVTTTHRTSATLNGGDVAVGGTLDLSYRLRWLRLGGQLGAETMLEPGHVDATVAGPLSTTDSAASPSSLLFLNVTPFAGLVTGDDVQGWLDLMLSMEIISARLGDGARSFSVLPVPTLRAGASFGVRELSFELFVMAAYFGGPRLTVGLGFRL